MESFMLYVIAEAYAFFKTHQTTPKISVFCYKEITVQKLKNAFLEEID